MNLKIKDLSLSEKFELIRNIVKDTITIYEDMKEGQHETRLDLAVIKRMYLEQIRATLIVTSYTEDYKVVVEDGSINYSESYDKIQESKLFELIYENKKSEIDFITKEVDKVIADYYSLNVIIENTIKDLIKKIPSESEIPKIIDEAKESINKLQEEIGNGNINVKQLVDSFIKK